MVQRRSRMEAVNVDVHCREPIVVPARASTRRVTAFPSKKPLFDHHLLSVDLSHTHPSRVNFSGDESPAHHLTPHPTSQPTCCPISRIKPSCLHPSRLGLPHPLFRIKAFPASHPAYNQSLLRICTHPARSRIHHSRREENKFATHIPTGPAHYTVSPHPALLIR